MIVVVINGSPHKNGLVSQILRYIIANLSLECNVKEVYVQDLNVKPCIGCMKCRSLGRCVLSEDDGHRVAELLNEADVLIIGSPCYWGNMTGTLKVLMDRVVYAMIGETENGMPIALHKGKKAILVSTCNTVWPFNVLFRQTSGVFRSLREILKWSGFSVVGKIAKSGCRKHREFSEKEKGKCKKIAEKIC